jgi:exonuclease V gamma subunit
MSRNPNFNVHDPLFVNGAWYRTLADRITGKPIGGTLALALHSAVPSSRDPAFLKAYVKSYEDSMQQFRNMPGSEKHWAEMEGDYERYSAGRALQEAQAATAWREPA